ncbi:aldo/keto reductase [Methylophaga sp. OBS4]|uniref:aldo/keto reductase n=1 Tax=Methylophaga sp. OBS4 TaxID=2991935 RepID=UPI00224D6A20|nr:aldo/keto reductase [Methylophaga sp. OBS4]MCX4187617.1 aldo/keto reductase [Methylophaga sp. OBS4]
MSYLSQRNLIADTGLAVSPLGLGTVKLGRDKAVKYPQGFKIPDDKQAADLLSQAWALGINLLDTAPAYGHSEQRLGQLLKQQNRDWIIATKAGEYFDPASGQSHYDFTPESLTASVENSLRLLQREVLDIVLIHSDGNDSDIIQRLGALDTLNNLKQRGLIRATGMSTKTVAGGLLALKQSDLVMVMHNLFYQEERAVLEQAARDNKGIFIKKALGSGHLAQDPDQVQTQTDIVQANFDFIFAEPAVTSVIIGTINPMHLADNVAKAIQAIKKN